MMEASINYYAVLAAAAAQMVIGFSWYSFAFFGKQWIALMGWDIKKMRKEPPKGMGFSMTGGVITALIMSYALSHVLAAFGARDWMSGLSIGLFVWAGFFATSLAGIVLWERKSPRLYFINAGYWLVTFGVTGAILGFWQ